MKKTYWLRRVTLAFSLVGVGAATTGYIPVWLRIVLLASVGGNLLLGEEFEFERRAGRQSYEKKS